MIGDLELNFVEDKTLATRAKADGKVIELEFDSGDVGLLLRLSKKQTAKLKATLEKY
jgi:hypothetical protein